MYYLYTSRPSLLFSAEWKGCAFQVSSIVSFCILYITTAKPFSVVRGYVGIMDKQFYFQSRVWGSSPGRSIFHKTDKPDFKILAYEIECCNRKRSNCEWDLDVRYAKERAPKQIRNLVNFDPANFGLSKIYQGNFQSLCRLALIPHQSFFGKRAKSLDKFFLQLWKCDLVDFIEISGNRCANTSFHWRRLKHPT